MFQAELQEAPTRVHVRVTGDLHREATGALRKLVAPMTQEACRDLVVEASGLDHVDGEGLALLRRVDRALAAGGCRVTLRDASPRVMTLCAMWGADRQLGFERTVGVGPVAILGHHVGR